MSGSAAIAAIVERAVPLSAEGLIEPIGAYAEAQGAGHLRLCSGDNPIAPHLIEVEGSDNAVVTGYRAGCRNFIGARIVGDRNVVFFGALSDVSGAQISIEGNDNFVFCGPLASAGEVAIWVQGNNSTTAIGDRSMLSNRIVIGRPDRRAMFSRLTGQRIDGPSDIHIGAHCWIGRNVLIEPGTTIGRETVVAQCAVLSGHYPEHSVLAGVPARVKREGITWARTSEETLEETFQTSHHKLFYVKHLHVLQARIAALRSEVQNH